MASVIKPNVDACRDILVYSVRSAVLQPGTINNSRWHAEMSPECVRSTKDEGAEYSPAPVILNKPMQRRQQSITA